MSHTQEYLDGVSKNHHLKFETSIFPLPKSMAMIFFNFQVFSASAGRWYAAEVGQVEGQGAGQDSWTIRSHFLWLMIRSTSVGSGELGYGTAFSGDLAFGTIYIYEPPAPSVYIYIYIL